MSQRRQLIAGNWKMNTSRAEAIDLARSLAVERIDGIDLVVCPPFPWLVPVSEILNDSSVLLGAQDCWPKPNGAYTGAVSISMLEEMCRFVIVGHSERRQAFGESDALVREKTSVILGAGLSPIICVGETLDIRLEGSAEDHVRTQLDAALSSRSAAEISACTIAYEPIWAIGTGIAASAEDAEKMATVIRQTVEAIQPSVAASIRVIYGGSVTPENSLETLRQPNIDGALIGGASLKAKSFLEIAKSAPH